VTFRALDLVYCWRDLQGPLPGHHLGAGGPADPEEAVVVGGLQHLQRPAGRRLLGAHPQPELRQRPHDGVSTRRGWSGERSVRVEQPIIYLGSVRVEPLVVTVLLPPAPSPGTCWPATTRTSPSAETG